MSVDDELPSVIKESGVIEETVLNTVAKFLSESSKTGCSTVEMVDTVVEELVKMGFDRISVENPMSKYIL